MSPPKVRFLTKIYHPNIGEKESPFCDLWKLTPRSARQTWPNMLGYLKG